MGHFTPIRMIRNKKIITNIGEDIEKLDPSYTAGGNVTWCSHFGSSSKT